ncbi:hypothetical protein BSKO_03478 [Bryopsis sp. KO-2023]|nr:hypothetical protein BSKO_03478 [Bryopsis sp. KO-2023]
MEKINAAVQFGALLVVATTLVSVVRAEEAYSSNFGQSFFRRTLLSSRDGLLDKKCNATSMDWVGGDKFQQPIILSDPGECCQKCQDIKDCVAWLWRGCCDHCWIKNSIPKEDTQRECDDDDCVSGQIRQVGTLKPSKGPIIYRNNAREEEKDEPLEYIQTGSNCERSGKVAAIGAAFQGCKAVVKQCKRPKKKDINQYKEMEGHLPAFESKPEAEGKAINSKKCARLSQNACVEQVADSEEAPVLDPKCMALLMEGPSSPSKGCKDQKEAQHVFEKTARAACLLKS